MNTSRIEQLVTSAVSRRVTEVADAIAAEAKRTAPVDTGNYREEIHVEQTGDPLKALVVSDAIDPQTGYHYSGIVEFKHTLTARGGNMARAAQTVRRRGL